MSSLLAFRHAEAAVNRPDLYVSGRGDSTYPITNTGVAQAQKAGVWAVETFEWIRNGDYTAAVSRFIRAQQTFEHMELPQAPLIICSGLIEHDWGNFMGFNPPEELRPSFDASYEVYIDVKAPSGESTLDLYQRTKTTLHELVNQFSAHHLVIVAHGRTLTVLRMIVEGMPATDKGWQYMRRHTQELPNCGALYYPEFRLQVEGIPNVSERMAIVVPPYCSTQYFRWQPFVGVEFGSTLEGFEEACE